MGEQEQSGMLRIVIVLGLIALIAGASIASVVTLKGQMASRSQSVTQKIDAAQPIDFNSYWKSYTAKGYSGNSVYQALTPSYSPGTAWIGKGPSYTKYATTLHSDNDWFRVSNWSNSDGGVYGQGWDLTTSNFKAQIYDMRTGQPAPSNVYYDGASSSYKIRK